MDEPPIMETLIFYVGEFEFYLEEDGKPVIWNGEGYFRTITLLLTVNCRVYKTGGRKTTKNTVLIFFIIEQFQKPFIEFPHMHFMLTY